MCKILQDTAELQNKLEAPNQTPVPDPSPVTASSHIHLAPMDLTPFDGNLDHWAEFITSFNTFVHQNQTLTPLLKLHYLKSFLKKEPLAHISQITTSTENYEIAYKTITNYYDNPRRSFSHHLSKLNQSSTPNLKEFYSRSNSAVTGLESSTIEDKFDYILLSLSLNGLDKETRKAFEVNLKSSTVPTVAELLEFVKERIRVQEISSNTMSNSQQAQTKQKPPSLKPIPSPILFVKDSHVNRQVDTNYVTTPHTLVPKPHNYATISRDYSEQYFNPPQNLRCPICHKPHRTFQCPDYSNSTPQGRLDWVRSNHRCTNCLGAHEFSKCNSPYRCRECGRSHHTTLHDILSRSSKNKISNISHSSRPTSPLLPI